jgi:hypothetical protein
MIVRAAAVQLSPVLHSRSGTMEKVLAAIVDVAKRGATLVVFPETIVPYYPYFSFVTPPAQMGPEHLRLYAEAVEVPGPETAAVGALAREKGIVVVLGVTERDRGTLYNAQLIFDADGTLVLKRRKITPDCLGAWATAAAGASPRRRRAAWARSRAGNTIIRSRATRSWRSTKRSTAANFRGRSSARSSPIRWRSRSVITRSNRAASWSTRPRG